MGTQGTVAKSFIHSLMIWRLIVTNLYLNVVRRYTCAAKLGLENKFVVALLMGNEFFPIAFKLLLEMSPLHEKYLQCPLVPF